MKALLIGALVALASPALAEREPTPVHTTMDVINDTAVTCQELLLNKTTLDAEAKTRGLDESQKRGLAFSCMMYVKGLEDGIDAATQPATPSPEGPSS
jgi:hypothetical protein